MTHSVLSSWQTAVMLRANLAMTSLPVSAKKTSANMDFKRISRYKESLSENKDLSTTCRRKSSKNSFAVVRHKSQTAELMLNVMFR